MEHGLEMPECQPRQQNTVVKVVRQDCLLAAREIQRREREVPLVLNMASDSHPGLESLPNAPCARYRFSDANVVLMSSFILPERHCVASRNMMCVRVLQNFGATCSERNVKL